MLGCLLQTMNHCVPDFELDEDYAIPTSSGLSRPKKSPMHEEEIMELLWQNGQVVMQSQNQRSMRRSQIGDDVLPPEQSAAREFRPEEESGTQLFMQEDEMASWLHYPIDDDSFERDLYADLIYPAPCAPAAPIPEVRTPEVRIPIPNATAAVASRPPIPPTRNFLHFSRPKGKMEPGPSSSNKAVRETTVVDSSETPALESRASHATAQVSAENGGFCAVSCGGAAAVTSSAAGGGGRETGMCELTVTSSSGGSGASLSANAEAVYKPMATEDRKRKGGEADDTECQSEDVEFESPDAKKQVRGSTSTKRSRAAEVHNLSERRRRDRINEKMRALQELIPRCNKSDKASMLDEAIEYLKSLQLQVQMMSMGCSMVPMMFPGVQQYMPPMGVGMGMAMGMEMGMNRPMMPFPSVLAGSALQTQAAAAHMGPPFPMQAFHMSPVPLPDPSRPQATGQSDLMLNSMGIQNPNQPRMPNFADPYQQYLGLHQMQLPLPQNQAMMQPSTSKPSSSRDVETRENPQSG
ncbi:Transcription factor like [Actinidia chinensis var. chinensis]|uniref:Transcription factor like n=1 Tax=Actinidia chinensis var. chinensis TaxID=1590841 RepID=A0A2R6PQ62_ACTCC|nr:Transcription factor like [Actinidia chinensis var. chinensis]